MSDKARPRDVLAAQALAQRAVLAARNGCVSHF